MDAAEKKQLEITACKVRMGIIEGVHSAKSGHPGGSLSCADILTYLYFKHMNIDPANPKKPTETVLCFQRVTLRPRFTQPLPTAVILTYHCLKHCVR